MRWVRGTVTRAGVYTLLWWLLTEGAGLWSYGIPIVVALTATTMVLTPPKRVRRRALPIRARAVVRVLVWFVGQSVTGALDVARRALRRPVDVAPVERELTLRLKSPVGRVLLADLASLTPGTLSVDFTGAGGHVLRLHVLHHEIDVADGLTRLEGLLIDLLDPPDENLEPDEPVR